MKRIALFGTSADPPTTGHKVILKWLAQNYDFVAVWAADNPFKTHQTSLEHRAGMLTVLIDSLEEGREEIALCQDLSNQRTIETVEKARLLWGERAEFTLVIGSDLLGQISRWYRIEELLRQVKILVIPRPGYPTEEKYLQELEDVGGEWAIANLDVPAVSSTAYRESKDPDVVTAPVEDYINQEQLYVCQDR